MTCKPDLPGHPLVLVPPLLTQPEIDATQSEVVLQNNDKVPRGLYKSLKICYSQINQNKRRTVMTPANC